MIEMFTPLTTSVVLSSDAGDDTVVVSGAGWTPDQFVGHQIAVRGGPGIGQVRTIVSNTADRLVVNQAWTVPPYASSLMISSPSTNRAAVNEWDAPRRQMDGFIPVDTGYGNVG